MTIIPQLPQEARLEIRSAASMGLLPVYRIVPAADYHKCKNCADIHFVYVSFLRKFWSETPPEAHKPATWLDADGDIHAGWRLIEKTVSYECPVCAGKAKPTHKSQSRPTQQATMELAKKLKSPEEDDWRDA